MGTVVCNDDLSENGSSVVLRPFTDVCNWMSSIADGLDYIRGMDDSAATPEIDRNLDSAPPPQSTLRSAWLLTALLALAPLLMLVTIWVLTLLRVK
jgi:hypothetical protein